MTLDEFNQLPKGEATEQLHRCCPASAWVEAMVNSRPFSSKEDLFVRADAVWNGLGESDWLEAFAGHPRIGTTKPTTDWSATEQAGMQRAGADERDEMAALNDMYLARFGFVFLICATGKSSTQMLTALKARLHNERSDELRNAAAEQAEIMKLRLEKLL